MTTFPRRVVPTNRLLSRILDEPDLVARVRSLAAPELFQLVHSVGLEDAAEIVSLTTTPQLENLFDEDLWSAEEGDEQERFDPTRFGLWLEVLLEAGEEAVVRRLCELPFDFVVHAFHRLTLVVDNDEMGSEWSEDATALEALDEALDSFLQEEWEEFRILSRGGVAWDAVWSSLVALDREHSDLLRRILERCAALTSQRVERYGYLAVLSSEEELQEDVRTDREHRRGKAGFVALADARAFLRLASRGLEYSQGRDPITASYFRELEHEDGSQHAAPPRRGTARSRSTENRWEERRLVEEGTPVVPFSRGGVEAALNELNEIAPRIAIERREELGYLANVLLAASSPKARPLRPVEALELALAVVEVGLSQELGKEHSTGVSKQLSTEATVLYRLGLDQLFRIGWQATAVGEGFLGHWRTELHQDDV